MTPEHASELTAKVCALAPVVPVIVVDDAAIAGDLATALVTGGLPALEVTLRTPAALDAIREMAKVEGGVVGAGTLLTPADVEAAKEAGATFGVSPGATDRLLDACEANDLPLLPARPLPQKPCVCSSAAIPFKSSSPRALRAARPCSKALAPRSPR